MNNQLTKYFSPTNDDGRLDCRFEEDLRIIFQSLSVEVKEGLDRFLQKTSELESSHGGYAMQLCEAFFKRMEYLDEYEREGSNQYRWKTKMLKDNLRKGLQETGFKPSKVSKLIGAAEFLSSTSTKIPFRKEIEELPIGSQYALSRMSHEGVSSALHLFEFNGKPTRDQLDKIAADFPKRQYKRDKDGLKPSEDDSTAVSETVSLSKYDKAKLFTELAIEISSEEEAWKDTELIKILNPVKHELWNIAHIAAEPIPETITI